MREWILIAAFAAVSLYAILASAGDGARVTITLPTKERVDGERAAS